MAKTRKTDGLTAASQARTGQGALFYFSEVGETHENATWTLLEGMKSGAIPVPSKPEIDVTTTASKAREFIAGLGTSPDMSVGLDFYPQNTVHQRVISDIVYDSRNRWWKIEIPNIVTIMVEAYVKEWPVEFNIDSAMTANFVLKTSGKPILVFPGSGAKVEWVNTLSGKKQDGSITGTVVGTLTVPLGYDIKFTDSVTDTQDFTKDTHYTVANLPVGVEPKVVKTSSTVVTMSVTGNAAQKEDIKNVTIHLMDAAFDGDMASKIIGSSKTDILLAFK